MQALEDITEFMQMKKWHGIQLRIVLLRARVFLQVCWFQLFGQPDILNSCWQDPKWCNDASCLKIVWRIMIQVNNFFSTITKAIFTLPMLNFRAQISWSLILKSLKSISM